MKRNPPKKAAGTRLEKELTELPSPSKARLSRARGVVGVSLLGLLALTVSIGFIPNLRTTPALALLAFGAWFTFAGLIFWVLDAVPRRALVIGLGVVHVAGLLVVPTLSDDQFRYVHEGRASRLSLETPYAVAPKDIRPPPNDGLSARVNHPEIPAAYPPFTQLVFLAAATLSDAVGSPFLFFRLLFLAADLGVLWVLFRFGHRRSFAWWGLHPLPLLECAIGAHVDALGVVLISLAVFALQNDTAKKRLTQGALIGLAIGVKPIAILATVGFRFRPRALAQVGAGVAFTLALTALPYVVTQTNVFRGLVEYSTRWQAQATGYAVIEAPLRQVIGARNRAGKWAHLTVSSTGIRITEAEKTRLAVGTVPAAARTLLLDARFFARGIALGLMLLAFGLIIRCVHDPLWAIAFTFLAFLLLTPAVHPWYWLWLLPFACATKSIGLWSGAALAPLSYEAAMRYAQTGVWEEAWWPRLLLLFALGVGLGVDFKRHRERKKGDASGPRSVTVAPSGEA